MVRAVERHARKLVRLHAKVKAEAIAIAGPDYDEHHAVGFEETASLDEQLRDTDTGCEVIRKLPLFNVTFPEFSQFSFSQK